MAIVKRALAVWWEDAFSHDAWTQDTDSIVRAQCLVLSVGLEVGNDEKGITLSLSANANGDRGGTWKIPRGMVRKVKVLGKLELPEDK